MNRQRPLILVVMGGCCCAFAAIWFLWLILGSGGDVLDLLSVAFGNRDRLESLTHRNLASAGPIRFAFTLLAMQVVLLGALGWTAYALLYHRSSARWSAIAFSVFAIATALLDTVVRIFFLTLPGEPVKVGPFLMDAVVILFAVNLGGTMFWPSVAEAFAGDLET